MRTVILIVVVAIVAAVTCSAFFAKSDRNTACRSACAELDMVWVGTADDIWFGITGQCTCVMGEMTRPK